ncbi:MAG TPA: ABC transporter permease [Burkholderiales bacterium]|nr:ABC transporter permease [Burkholderiales bacterium]
MRWREIVEPAILLLVLALLWEKAVVIFGIKQYLLPPLSQVLDALWQNRAMILEQTWVTTVEILIGYFWAVVGGILLGLAIFAWPPVRRTLYPLIVLFQGLPKVALAPLFVVWFGYGLASKVLMAFLFAFFPVVVGTLGGLAGTPAHLIEHFRAIRASPMTTFLRLRIPAALPSIMDGCKTAMPLAVIGAVVGEFVGAENGLGHLILAANANARTDLMFAALIAISALAGVLYLLVELAANRIWWRAL